MGNEYTSKGEEVLREKGVERPEYWRSTHMDVEITKSYDGIEDSNNEPGANPLKNEGCDQEVTDDCNKVSK